MTTVNFIVLRFQSSKFLTKPLITIRLFTGFCVMTFQRKCLIKSFLPLIIYNFIIDVIYLQLWNTHLNNNALIIDFYRGVDWGVLSLWDPVRVKSRVLKVYLDDCLLFICMFGSRPFFFFPGKQLIITCISLKMELNQNFEFDFRHRVQLNELSTGT